MPLLGVTALLLPLPPSFTKPPADRTTALDSHMGSRGGNDIRIHPAEEKL